MTCGWVDFDLETIPQDWVPCSNVTWGSELALADGEQIEPWGLPLSSNVIKEPEVELPEEEEIELWESPLPGNVTQKPDVPDLDKIPLVLPFELPKTIQPKAPDISQGLGKRKDRVDLVSLQRFVAQSRRFMVLNEELCVYRPPCWKILSALEAEREIRALVENHEQGYCLTQREYEKIRCGLLNDPSITLKRGEIESAEGKINFQDGTYDTETGHFLVHNPNDYFFSALNVCFQDAWSSSGTVFEQFVERVSGGDPRIREQLLQLVALVILRKPLKHFFVLVGPSNTGKSQIGRFLEELVGPEQAVCIRDVHDFTDRWTVGTTRGKALALCLDLPDAPLPVRAVGFIKQFTGDDPMKSEEKYKNPGTFRKKPLLVLAGNHPIRIKGIDQEEAFLNRMITIYFQNPVQGSEMRQELYRDFLWEAPYIIRQAIKAYERLRANHFELTQPPLPKEYAPRDVRGGVTMDLFLRECCEFVPGAKITTQSLRDAYCAFSGTNPEDTSTVAFSRDLSKELRRYPEVRAVKAVEGDMRGYRGLRLLGDKLPC